MFLDSIIFLVNLLNIVDYIQKPFDIEDLLKRVKKVVG